MSSPIPIQNLYFLLSYAWDHFHEGDEVDVSADACPDLANLLARVLALGIERLVRRGLDQQYVETQEALAGLRGKVLVAESYRRMTHRSGRMECRFDELSPDVPPNRILRSTCDRFLSNPSLTHENRHLVRMARRWLAEVRPIRLNAGVFRRIQFHRNNRSYRFLIHVCRLAFDCLLPEESSGTHRFHDILRDDLIMPRLFEAFVRNFARRHCRGARVSAMGISWDVECDEASAEALPGMLTDVTVSWPGRKLILDCKFYREAMGTREGRQKLHSANLYQLVAYLKNKARDPGWETVEGMLLYPAVRHDLDFSYRLLGHAVRIRSIDLDQGWQDIERDLLEVLHPERQTALAE